MSIRDAAKDTIVDVANGVARTIASESKSRREEPEYWASFHEVQMQSLPKWRWAARLWHQARARMYHSHAVSKRRGAR